MLLLFNHNLNKQMTFDTVNRLSHVYASQRLALMNQHHKVEVEVQCRETTSEPVREKTNNLGYDQVRHKLGCTVKEDG